MRKQTSPNRRTFAPALAGAVVLLTGALLFGFAAARPRGFRRAASWAAGGKDARPQAVHGHLEGQFSR